MKTVFIGVILCFCLAWRGWTAPEDSDKRELLNGFLQSLNVQNGIMHTGVNCFFTSTNCGGTSFETPQWTDCCFIYKGLSYRDVRGGLCLSCLGGKVKVGLYCEALSPGCLDFINYPLTKAFNKVPDIFTLHYVPLGNAKMVNGKLECLNGPMECTMNTIEACALYYYPNMTQYWPFLACLAHVGTLMDPGIAERCAEMNDMTWDKINMCYQGELGCKLELGYYNETRSLEPALHYTPWVTINGEHYTSAEGIGLVRRICYAYGGTNRPKACIRHP